MQTTQQTYLQPWNPLQWVHILWWFLLDPAEFKAHETSPDPALVRNFRQCAAWIVNILYWFPLIILSIYIGTQPSVIDALRNAADPLRWFGENWIIVPFLLACLLVAGAMLDPVIAENRTWTWIATRIVGQMIRFGLVLAAALGFLIIQGRPLTFAILLNFGQTLQNAIIFGLLTAIPFGLATAIANSSRLGALGAPATFATYCLALLVASTNQGGVIFLILWGYGFSLGATLLKHLKIRYTRATYPAQS